MAAVGFQAGTAGLGLPGGLPLVNAVGAGLSLSSQPGSVQGAQVRVPIGYDPDALYPGFSAVNVEAPGGLVMTQQATLQIAQSVAWSVPHAVNSGVQHSAAAAVAVMQPVRELAKAVDPFRGAPLPRITGLENLPTLSEMVADALEGTRIGTYTPPNPKLPGGNLSDWLIAGAIGTALGRTGLLLAQQLAQLWGGKNSRGYISQAGSWQEIGTDFVPIDVPGLAVISLRDSFYEKATDCNSGQTIIDRLVTSSASAQASSPSGFQLSGSVSLRFSNGCAGPSESFVRQPVSVVWSFPDGTTQTAQLFGGASGGSGAGIDYFVSYDTEVLGVTVAGVPLSPPDVFVPGGETPNPVEFDRSSAPAPSPVPALPLPTSPALPAPAEAPAVSPGPQPAPGRAPAPATFPSISPSRPPLPTPAPGVPALPGDGRAPAPIPVPTPTTPPTTVIPWPGAPPIGGPGQAPAPTLTGIAQEVGRIERKIDVMMGPRPGGQPQEPRNWQDQLDDLMDWIERLEFGGSYELRGVCEVDANGEPVETVVDHPWPPGVGVDAGLYGRLDAIAAMLQTHKELRQPICRGPKAQGEPVTVQFEEL